MDQSGSFGGLSEAVGEWMSLVRVKAVSMSTPTAALCMGIDFWTEGWV